MIKEIYLAGGCFWGVEHLLKQINGVVSTEVGYANGNTENPDYRSVCGGRTGYAETVHLSYDSEKVTLKLILEVFFQAVDPTSFHRQGMDFGSQYRSGIYYVDEEDIEVSQNVLNDLSTKYRDEIVVELEPMKNFVVAEEYHQKYLDNNAGGYCHINPQLFEMARKANAE